MNRYHVRYMLSPAVPLDKEIRLVMADRVVEEVWVNISPVPKEDQSGKTVFDAMAMDFQMDAEKLDVALDRSYRLCGFIMSVISFLTCTGLPYPRIEVALDMAEENTEHDLLQVLGLGFSRVSERTLSRKAFEGFLTNCKRLEGEEAESAMFRAMRWFAHANQESNYLFRLLAYWFALEALNTYLVEDEKDFESEISELKARGTGSIPRTLGIKLFMKSIDGIDPLLYDKVRKLRNDLVHASGKLGEIEEEAKSLCPQLGAVTFRAISTMVSHEPPEGFSTEPELASSLQRLSIRATLFHPEPGFFGLEDELPHFDEGPIRELGKGIVKLARSDKIEKIPLIPRMKQGIQVETVALTLHDREIEWASIKIVVDGKAS